MEVLGSGTDRMSTQTADYMVQRQPAPGRPRSSDLSDPQGQVTTDEMGPVEQNPLRPSLVDAWVKALRAAESLHLCLHPTYLRRSESELLAFVRAALRGHRDPSQLVTELLTAGTGKVEGPAKRAWPEHRSGRAAFRGFSRAPSR